MFQELSSCPATMEAAKAADCYGLLEGHVVEQADAEQAYTQSKLGGTPTWIRIPRERWPQAWANMRDPVCPLVLALYGHPDAGGYWERHCAAHLRSVGFQDIPDWRSCFWHPRYKVYLTVYVDDFKMAGPKRSMASAWADIRKGVKTGDPEPAGFYLGCRHVLSTRSYSPQCLGSPSGSLSTTWRNFLFPVWSAIRNWVRSPSFAWSLPLSSSSHPATLSLLAKVLLVLLLAARPQRVLLLAARIPPPTPAWRAAAHCGASPHEGPLRGPDGSF